MADLSDTNVVYKSSLYNIDVSGKKSNYEFQFRDNKLVGATKINANGNFEAIDPSSSEWQTITTADDDQGNSAALKAYNLHVNGKDGVETAVVEVDFEELNNFYVDNKTKLGNEEKNVNDNNDLNVATEPPKSAYAAYKESRGKKIGTDIYTYPLDIDPLQDHLKISKYKYQRPETNFQGSRPPFVQKGKVIGRMPGSGFLYEGSLMDKLTGISDSLGTKEEIKVDVDNPGDSVRGSQLEGSVILPMPKVVDTNGAEWGDSEMNVIALAAATVSGQGLGLTKTKVDQLESEFGISKQLRSKLRKIRGNPDKTTSFGEVKDLFASAVASSAIIRSTGQTITEDQLLARAQGTVLNPNAELLFGGPVLRDFNFDFLMVARSEKEGAEIRKIIRWFKTGMAPSFNSAALLNTPDIFTLEYKRGKGENDVLDTVNRFNPGGLALRTFAVDYAPNGYWSAYQDSQPVALKISMNFAELRPIYKSDQESTPPSSVGY